jgi:hypothetical protein
LASQFSNHSVSIQELRPQDFAVVTCVAYPLFDRINSRVSSAGRRLNKSLALNLAHLKRINA